MGTELKLRFSLPDSATTIRCQGHVTWIYGPGEGNVPHLPGGMGIVFDNMAGKDRERIQEFVKRQFIAQMR